MNYAPHCELRGGRCAAAPTTPTVPMKSSGFWVADLMTGPRADLCRSSSGAQPRGCAPRRAHVMKSALPHAKSACGCWHPAAQNHRRAKAARRRPRFFSPHFRRTVCRQWQAGTCNHRALAPPGWAAWRPSFNAYVLVVSRKTRHPLSGARTPHTGTRRSLKSTVHRCAAMWPRSRLAHASPGKVPPPKKHCRPFSTTSPYSRLRSNTVSRFCPETEPHPPCTHIHSS